MRSVQEETLDDYLNYINNDKRAQSNPLFKQTTVNGAPRVHDPRNLAPSGPRRPGEGVEDEDQGIICAEKTEQGAVYVYITLLAAGFVIGPKGRSIHQICHVTGADVRSWSTQFNASSKKSSRALRVFQIQGDVDSVLDAMKIMVTAVDRYKELSEGKFEGQVVDKEQTILGIEFHYQPPPKHAVPVAARIKSENFLDTSTMYNWDLHRIPLQEQTGDNNGNIYLRPAGLMRAQSLGTVWDNVAGYPREYVNTPRGAMGYIQMQNASPYPYYQYVVAPNLMYGQPVGYESVQWQNASPTMPASSAAQAPPSQAHAFVPALPLGAPIPQPNAGTLRGQYPTNTHLSYAYSQNSLPAPPNPIKTQQTTHQNRSHLGTFFYPHMYGVDVVKEQAGSPTGIEEDFTQL